MTSRIAVTERRVTLPMAVSFSLCGVTTGRRLQYTAAAGVNMQGGMALFMAVRMAASRGIDGYSSGAKRNMTVMLYDIQ